MSHRLRRAAQVAFWIASGCLLAVGVIGVVRLAQAAPSAATAQRLNVATTVSGGIAAAAAIVGAILTYKQRDSNKTDRSKLLVSRLWADERLINRVVEMRDLVAQIDEHPVVGCHGPRGAGKSFLLEHLADVVNRNRRANLGQPKPKRVSAALYFDLAAAAGFADVHSQICGEALGDPEGSWKDFVAYVERRFRHQRVLLILDNVNSPGLWRELGEAVFKYLQSRPKDRVVLGSIDPVTLGNMEVQHVPVLGLDLVATKELVATCGVAMSCEELVKLHGECGGLPLYIRLLVAHGEEARSGQGTAVLDEQLIPELPTETRRLLSYVSLIGLITRRISLTELAQFPLANPEDQLAIAENRTLIAAIPDDGGKRFKIHDIVRDTALRVLAPDVSEAALILFEREYGRGRLEHAALYAMFADSPEEIGAARLQDLLEQVIRTAVNARNYALLGNLYARAHEHTNMLFFIARDQVRADLFHFARASELAGLGRYEQAEEELLLSSVVRTRWGPDTEGTDLEADLRFLQADIAHLLNRYDESAQMFEDLGNWAATTNRYKLRALCVWGQGHVLRHQGRDLEKALSLFEQAAGLAEAAGELFPRVKAVTGATGIKVLIGVVPNDEEDLLAALEREIAASSTHDGYMLEVWKYQAQIAWLRGRRRKAAELIESAIERALALNDRLLYNLYFERAEYARLTGDYPAALRDYGQVLDFGNGNRDRNLIANALLGNVLVELAMGQWRDHLTREEARASVLRARQIAIEADIAITAATADAVVVMLDEPAPTPESIRLILL
ncbi:MAG TPA: AAA family ATPase [Microbacteriaceae bacterium]|nr:AAA family ATPase [Microbacteriaceae bacterium]